MGWRKLRSRSTSFPSWLREPRIRRKLTIWDWHMSKSGLSPFKESINCMRICRPVRKGMNLGTKNGSITTKSPLSINPVATTNGCQLSNFCVWLQALHSRKSLKKLQEVSSWLQVLSNQCKIMRQTSDSNSRPSSPAAMLLTPRSNSKSVSSKNCPITSISTSLTRADLILSSSQN